MSITPGPNNVMLTAAGANFGFRRTLPHMLGISLGFAFQTMGVCLGLGAAFARIPHLQDALAWVGAAYLVFLPKSGDLTVALGIMFVIMAGVNFCCITLWAGFGSAMRRFLDNPVRRKIFNAMMAVLLAATAVMMVVG